MTDQVGLHFVHDAGPTGSYFMPQIVGSGAALFDFDGDGLLDIYLLQNGGPNGARNQLFHQLPNGHFEDVSQGSGLDVAGYSMGVAIGNVNNDGRPDVLLTQYGGVKLFLNEGGGHFKDVTKEAGLDSLHWGTSACFFDYDRDGWLDLVVVNYVSYDPDRACGTPRYQRDYCAPSQFAGTVTNLYHNRGGGGPVHFDDVTVASGLDFVPGPGLGVACADFDGDGWPDIFVANDGRPNRLWINQHNGTFKEEAVKRGVAYNAMGSAQAGMGVAVGDVNDDGLCDLFVTHLTEETNALWVQGAPGLFRDRTAASGLAATADRGTGFGTVLADFDQDGALDLAVVNGRVYAADRSQNPALGPFWGLYAERSRLWAGTGDGRFRDISESNGPFCATPAVARGLACGERRWGRRPRLAGDDGRRAGAAVPQHGPPPRPLASGPSPRPGPAAGRLRGRDHGSGRRPPLEALAEPRLRLPVQQRPAGPLRAGYGRPNRRHRRGLAGRRPRAVPRPRRRSEGGPAQGRRGGSAPMSGERRMASDERRGQGDKGTRGQGDQPLPSSPSPRLPYSRSRRGRRGVLTATLIVGGALLAGGIGLAFWFGHSPPPQPPTIDLSGLDPAVAAAIALERDAVLQSPRSIDAWGRLGMVLLANQFRPEAADCFAQAERLADRDGRWPYLRALALQRSDPEAAVAELRRALDLGGDEVGPARPRLAELLLEQGRLEEADREFRLALASNPDDARATSDWPGWNASATPRRPVFPTWSARRPTRTRGRRPLSCRRRSTSASATRRPPSGTCRR